MSSARGLDPVAEAPNDQDRAPLPRVQEVAACPVCASSTSCLAFVAPDALLGVPGEYRYVRCESCGSYYQNPAVVEEDLPMCYPAAYFTHDLHGTELSQATAPPASVRGRLRAAIRQAADGSTAEPLGVGLEWLGRLLARVPSLRRRARYGLPDPLGTPGGQGLRCLEVGPGRGLDLLQLKRIGWEAYGLEMDPEAAANARAISGCEVRVGTLLTTDYAPASFNLMYMSHVLEHLPRLERSLARCFELLAPEGRLFLVYPNPSALTTRVYGRRSPVWEPPRHLTIPQGRALFELLSRLGFVRVRTWTTALHAAAYRRVSLRQAGGQRGLGEGGPSVGDRGFAAIEKLLVFAGADVGEEIIAVAHRPGRG